MKKDSCAVAHQNLASDITTTLNYLGSTYLSKGKVIHLQKKCKNLKVELAVTATSHTAPFNWILHQQFESVFKCLLEVLDQRTEAKKPPKLQIAGYNVGSSSEEDNYNDDSAHLDPPVWKVRGCNKKRRKAGAGSHRGG